MKYSHSEKLELVDRLIETLGRNQVVFDPNDFYCFSSIEKRGQGVEFGFSDHLKGIVYALLGSQRTWEGIRNNYAAIDRIFLQFDRRLFALTSISEILKELKSIKCGNKNIRRQIEGLVDIINTLEKIENRFSTVDAFIMHKSPLEIAALLTKSEYKFRGLGPSLVFEYLRNVGVDVAKPDTHLMRLFGPNRLGVFTSEKSSQFEAVALISDLADVCNMSPAALGTSFWLLCARGYGNICGATPKCELCELRERFCSNVKHEGETC